MRQVYSILQVASMIQLEREKIMPPVIQNMLPKDFQDYSCLIDSQIIEISYTLQQRSHHFLTPQQKEVLKNQDVGVFTIRMLGEEHTEEDNFENENVCDDNLRRKIEQYNKIAKPTRGRERDKSRRGRKSQDSQDGKPKRKVRTTITPAKLEEMNKIFKEYLESHQASAFFSQKMKDQRENMAEDEERQKMMEMDSLKSIGQKLGLGYSTILHKFRQFRATKKVKGGALIAALNQKRKYKKSKEIEQLIRKSLKEGSFFTAVELANYIKNNYGRILSRSIISRHLGEMGYSYKNVKERPVNKNAQHIKELRKKFAVALTLLRDKLFSEVYYLDQYVFSLNELPRKHYQSFGSSFNSWSSNGELYLTMLASAQGVIKFQLRVLPMLKEEFLQFLMTSEKCLSEHCLSQPRIIVMDMDNPIHFCDQVIVTRKAMRARNTKLFYLPPYSHQLNLLQWVLPEIKESLMQTTFDGLDDLKVSIEEHLKVLCSGDLQKYSSQSEAYLRKSMICQNF